MSDRVWKDRAPRYARFFGPNVRATLKKYDAANRLVELSLITTAEGEEICINYGEMYWSARGLAPW